MSGIKDGGPAFPCELSTRFQGMTLRDYFAAKASKEDVDQVMLENFDFMKERYLITRQQARYIHADAMLSERAK